MSDRGVLLAAAFVVSTLAACSKPATNAGPTPRLVGPVTPATITASATTAPPLAPLDAAIPATPASGYSCSFPGAPGGREILARFTVDGATAHDDQGLPFTVLTDSPTALVLAHARDDLAVSPNGDVGAYVVAIDRRSLGMVQTTVGLTGPGATRHGHCIAG